MKSKSILIVDDDRRIRDLLGRYLHENGYQVESAGTLKEAGYMLEFATDSEAHSGHGDSGAEINLMILDVMLPDGNGMEFLGDLRARGIAVPTIMLTALGESINRIDGLKSGADDYLPKPFEPEELLLRVNALLRRAYTNSEVVEKNQLMFGDFTYNLKNGTLYKSGEVIDLSSTELLLMALLAEHSPSPVSREEIARTTRTSERTVDVQISRLRRKIEQNPKQPKYIHSIRFKGYALKG
jgi:two-component system phosphate regulon response regulator OmpR